MMAGVRPSEFWDLTPAEYNLIVEAYKDHQKETKYRELRNAYYTGCFAQVTKPHELYEKIIADIDEKPQTAEEIFNFLKSMPMTSGGDVLSSHFKIPLKLTPEFDAGIFSYIYRMGEEKQELYLPDVALSMDGETLKPNHDTYSIRPGIVKIKYSGQVYTIMIIKA